MGSVIVVMLGDEALSAHPSNSGIGRSSALLGSGGWISVVVTIPIKRVRQSCWPDKR